MKQIFASLLAFSLMGCSTLGLTQTSLLAAVSDLQVAAVKACGFLPTVEGGLALLGSTGSVVSTAADALCKLVPPPIVAAPQGLLAMPSASRAGQPGQVTVNGVAVKGTYVR